MGFITELEETRADSDEPPSLDAQLTDILECFDFALMQRVMEFMGWRWAGVDEVTGAGLFLPTEDDLRIVARRMLCEVAAAEGDATRQTAGFKATKRHGYLTLYFVAEYWEILP